MAMGFSPKSRPNPHISLPNWLVAADTTKDSPADLAISTIAIAVSGFTICEDSIRSALERNPILVTALNPVIGYELGAETAKKAYIKGKPIKAVALKTTGLSAEELDRLLDPLELTRGGIKS